MERILDVYKWPYNPKFPVICMDESPKQLISEGRPKQLMEPGRYERVDYEYVRHGVVNIFMATEPLVGNQFIKVTESKTMRDWAQFIKEVADQYAQAQKIILVMDNYCTHTAASFYETFEPKEAKALWDRFEFVFTPKHGSWLNMAEIEFHSLNRQCLNRHIGTINEVEEEVNAWHESRKTKDCKINWQFTTKDARIKLKRLYPSINA